MREASVRTLLDAVRRRLWRESGRVAVRRAGWLSAATMLLAGAIHLTATPLPVDAVLGVLLLEWAFLLGWAAWRRPTDADGALWIDRHLGGASAFTTLLDPIAHEQTPTHAQALRWLEQWALAQVPAVLRALGERPSSVRVSRSLLSMTVCSALALFVLTLSDTAPARHPPTNVAAPASPGDKTTASVEVPVTAQLASEIATALRSTERRPGDREPRGAGDAPSEGAPPAGDGASAPARAPRATLRPQDAPTTGDGRSPGAVDADASVGAGQSAAAVGGHDAGDSPDARVDLGVSRAPAGTIAGARSASTPGRAGAERRADMDQAARFDEGVSAPGSARPGAVPSVAAATPPPAMASARLSAVESRYVEAWMKATGRSR